MVFAFVVSLVIIIAIIYGLLCNLYCNKTVEPALCTHENNQLAAAASVIRQIWSGKCALSCQNTGCHILDDDNTTSEGRSASMGADHATREPCACNICPCEVIGGFVVACSPGTRLITTVTNTAAHYYIQMLQFVIDLTDCVLRVIECGTSCLREAQMPNETAVTPRTLVLNDDRQERLCVGTNTSREVFFDEPKKPSDTIKQQQSRTSTETLKAPSRSGCSKCEQEGTVCEKKCPKNKNTKKK